MKIKTIVAVLANVFLISNAVSANEMQAPEVKVQEKNPCKEKTFWQTNFTNGQFNGFYSQMTNSVISNAQHLFANHYFEGSVFNKDLARALDLYQRAHLRGNHDSTAKLGLVYRYGLSTNKDYQKAIQYYESIAANNPEAQFNLGLMHRYGIGTASNQQQAFQYFKQAASNQVVAKNNCEVEVEGMAEAQFHLGQMFRYGLGVDKNLDQALLWFKEAAKQDLKEAQFNAAQLMMTGVGEHYDYDGAIQYYQRAAEQGAR